MTKLKKDFANPDYVIKHKASDKIELIYPQKDYKNRTVYCIVILNTDTKHSKEKIDVHVMTTAYGKSKIEKYVEIASEEGRLIYSKEEPLISDSYVRYEGYAKSDSSSKNKIARNNENVNKKSYSFGDEDLDFGLYLSEDSEVADNLKDSGRAVGGLFETTSEAKLEDTEVNRVLNKNLKNFKVTGDLSEHRKRIAQIVALTEKNDYVDGGAVVGEIATVMKDAIMHSDYVVDNYQDEREDIISRMKGVGKIYLTPEQVASRQKFAFASS